VSSVHAHQRIHMDKDLERRIRLTKQRAEQATRKHLSKKKSKKNKKRDDFEKLAQNLPRDYSEFLQTPYWKKIRRLVLKRDNNICKECGSVLNIQVHHIEYTTRGTEHQNLSLLVSLCDSCHSKTHRIRDLEQMQQRFEFLITKD